MERSRVATPEVMTNRHDVPMARSDTGMAKAPSRRGTPHMSGTCSRHDGSTALAATEREVEMNRGGGVGIIGVIVIVVVILFLVGVIRL
jgi:cobalamin biosynthesis Mg chelatase CobN